MVFYIFILKCLDDLLFFWNFHFTTWWGTPFIHPYSPVDGARVGTKTGQFPSTGALYVLILLFVNVIYYLLWTCFNVLIYWILWNCTLLKFKISFLKFLKIWPTAHFHNRSLPVLRAECGCKIFQLLCLVGIGIRLKNIYIYI